MTATETSMTQTQAIINHMREYGGITSKEAFENYGATRLSGIIYRLKHQGYTITKTSETCITRFGQIVTYARYSIAEDDESETK